MSFAQEPSLSQESSISESASQPENTDVRSFRSPFLSWLPEAPKIDINIPTPVIPQENIAPPSFNIQGLIWNTSLPQAIVDNQVVKVGDMINGAEVLDITKEGVTVKYQNNEFILKPQVVSQTEVPGSDYKRMGGRIR